MLYRWFTVDGQVTDRIDSTDGESFPTPIAIHCAEVAAQAGVAVSAVHGFEGEDAPAPQRTLTPSPAPVVPDAPAFKLAAYAYLGAAAFMAPLSGYIAPTLDALNAGNWGLARQIIGYARQANALTAQQYADINALLAEYGIPEA